MGATWHSWHIGGPAPLAAGGQDPASGHPLRPAVSAELIGEWGRGCCALRHVIQDAWRWQVTGHSDLCLGHEGGPAGHSDLGNFDLCRHTLPSRVHEIRAGGNEAAIHQIAAVSPSVRTGALRAKSGPAGVANIAPARICGASPTRVTRPPYTRSRPFRRRFARTGALRAKSGPAGYRGGREYRASAHLCGSPQFTVHRNRVELFDFSRGGPQGGVGQNALCEGGSAFGATNEGGVEGGVPPFEGGVEHG